MSKAVAVTSWMKWRSMNSRSCPSSRVTTRVWPRSCRPASGRPRRCPKSRSSLAASVHQPFALHPVLDQVGDLVGVRVHHHHVRVAGDPDLRQLDPFDVAPARLEVVGELARRRLLARPDRVLVDEVAPDDEDGDALEFVELRARRGAPAGSMAIRPFTLSGALSAAWKPKLPACEWNMSTALPTFCTSAWYASCVMASLLVQRGTNCLANWSNASVGNRCP